LITWLPVGGIERRLVAVLPRLMRRGFDVRLVCLREEGVLGQELRDQGVPLDVIPMRSRLDPLGVPKLSRYLREHRTQLVHAHMYRSMVPGTVAAKLAKVPVVFSQVHNVGTWESKRQKGMDRFLSNWRTGTICVSRAVQDDVVRTLGIPREKAPVLYNGIDTEAYHPDAALRSKTRAELGIAEDQVVAFVPARLHSNKNPIGVVEAFEKAAADQPNALLLWAGHGPMEEQVAEAIQSRGLGGRFRLLGRRDDMAALYNAADVMVLSSFKEGFSNAVIEALACGTPVIAADVGGNREAIHDESVGWIHNAGDNAKLAEQLHHAFSRSEALAAMADKCRERAMVFSLDALVDQTDKLYRDAIARASACAKR